MGIAMPSAAVTEMKKKIDEQVEFMSSRGALELPRICKTNPDQPQHANETFQSMSCQTKITEPEWQKGPQDLTQQADEIKKIQNELGRTKRKIDTVYQVVDYVLEGSERVEASYVATVETENGGGWKKFKEEIGNALSQELHEAFGLPWPTTPEHQRIGMLDTDDFDWTAERKSFQYAIDLFVKAWAAGKIANIKTVSKGDTDRVFTRKEGNFTVHLRFSIEPLEAKKALEDVIEGGLRRVAHLPCRQGGNLNIPGRENKRFLVYLNKTDAQKEGAKKARERQEGGTGSSNNGAGCGQGRRGRGRH